MSSDLIKLYYRIGEVSTIVGVQPHVLRYWESEFRTIRPQKSSKGQRVYSKRDVERLLFVKDLLKNQGFTIAGAKRRLREPMDASAAPLSALASSAAPSSVGAAASSATTSIASAGSSAAAQSGVAQSPVHGTAAATPSIGPSLGAGAEAWLQRTRPLATAPEARVDGKLLRRALLAVREDLASWIHELEAETPARASAKS